jgi:hypothetical protein
MKAFQKPSSLFFLEGIKPMRTPAGVECKFFYGNYLRGRKQEECRRIGNAPAPHHWTPDICQKCPVPEILRANACEFMELHAQVERPLFGLQKKVVVTAYCTKSQQVVDEPEVGCGECHPLPPAFLKRYK